MCRIVGSRRLVVWYRHVSRHLTAGTVDRYVTRHAVMQQQTRGSCCHHGRPDFDVTLMTRIVRKTAEIRHYCWCCCALVQCCAVPSTYGSHPCYSWLFETVERWWSDCYAIVIAVVIDIQHTILGKMSICKFFGCL